jgi:hypothetical protein
LLLHALLHGNYHDLYRYRVRGRRECCHRRDALGDLHDRLHAVKLRFLQ